MKAEELLAAPDAAFALDARPGEAPAVLWDGIVVAQLTAGSSLIAPTVRLDRAVMGLGQDLQKRVAERLGNWLTSQKVRHLTPLLHMSTSAADPAVPAVVRAVFAQLVDVGGIAPRADMDAALGHLDKDQRSVLRRAGIVVGVLDLFHAGLLKPGAALWRMALLAARSGKPMLPLPPAGAVLLASGERTADMGAKVAGFRAFGPQLLRIDLAERMARAAHEAIGKGEAFTAASPQVVSLGLLEPGFLQMMRAAGFRPVAAPVAAPEAGAAEGEVAAAGANWAFRGRPKTRPKDPEPVAPPSGGQAFAGLAALLGRSG